MLLIIRKKGLFLRDEDRAKASLEETAWGGQESILAERTGLGASWRSWPGHLGVGEHVYGRLKVELEKVDTEDMFRRGKKVSMILAII